MDVLDYLSTTEDLVVVEGKKDAAALSSFGASHIYILSKPLYRCVEEIVSSGRSCIILTDFDPEGKRLFSYLRDALQRRGVKTRSALRFAFFRETNITTVESLSRHLV
ncbi:hypothetical protein J4430_01250 [Candidatus Woesearchaeota archaeon]|nr:hypothetical protein [Candidatus Woesearchaeota archaeon]